MRTTLTLIFFFLMAIRCYTVAEMEPTNLNSRMVDTVGYRALPNGFIRPNGDTAYKNGKMYIYP